MKPYVEHTTTTRRRALDLVAGGASLRAAAAAVGASRSGVFAWVHAERKRAAALNPAPPPPPPPPPVAPRRIPIAGCEHFRMGHRTLCTACYCAVQRGEAVLG